MLYVPLVKTHAVAGLVLLHKWQSIRQHKIPRNITCTKLHPPTRPHPPDLVAAGEGQGVEVLGVGQLEVSPPVQELRHDGQVVELGSQVEGTLL